MTARPIPVGVFVFLLRETLESDPFYSNLWIEGEITDLTVSRSGHTYFSLRDVDGAMKCVLFRTEALRQRQSSKIGDNVIVHGGLSLYPATGGMQLVVDLIRAAGVGVASLELEYLRQQLEAEGLFDPYRKRALPPWPRRIGVVTSPHGAAWRDIQNVIGRRYPLVELILSPAQVQGAGSPESIVAAVEALQIGEPIDVLILARGGGASDDLSAFNDERVVRAVFASRVPVVAGIGHATDRTLVEDAADAAGATPSAAAEISVPSISELMEKVESHKGRLNWSMASRCSAASARARWLTDQLAAHNPRFAIQDGNTAIQRMTSKLAIAVENRSVSEMRRLSNADALLRSLDPAGVLRRGYAALLDPVANQSLFSATQLLPGLEVCIVMSDGVAGGTIHNNHGRNEPSGAT